MKILITGVAGFIGFHLSKVLLDAGYTVVGIDNVNDYYDVNLKYARLNKLGIQENNSISYHRLYNSNLYEAFKFMKIDIVDKEQLLKLFELENFDIVCNLAAQAGVRYSIENPDVYIQSNIVGFLNVLECIRSCNIKHFIYASSSSVYGANSKIPFSESDQVDNPVSLYAATKKSNELIAYTYSHLYNIQTTGLRFFTVYGPWGRPDMAPFLFADAISKEKPIKVFNFGDMQRDFTYIDDIVGGIKNIIEKPIKDRSLYKIYNIGNSNPINLLAFIKAIETNVGKTAVKEMLPIQPGDVQKTWADVTMLKRDYGYKADTDLEVGVTLFVKWFKDYYNIK